MRKLEIPSYYGESDDLGSRPPAAPSPSSAVSTISLNLSLCGWKRRRKEV